MDSISVRLSLLIITNQLSSRSLFGMCPASSFNGETLSQRTSIEKLSQKKIRVHGDTVTDPFFTKKYGDDSPTMDGEKTWISQP